MTQRSMFFDSSSGDRIYTSDSWAQIFGRVFSDGVVAGYASGCAVAASGPAAMSVVVPLGSLWVQGRFLDVYTSNETLTVLTSDPTNPRIDRVVARIDYTGRTLSLAVLKGTAAATPVAPTLTQNTTTWEMSLAQIRVNAGATSIVTANITDERTFITNAAAIAFAKVVAGATTLSSTQAGDTLTLAAGSGITITGSGKTATIAVTANSVDAATLDGIDSTGFSLVTHNHDGRYLLLTGSTQTVAGSVTINNGTGTPLTLLGNFFATEPALAFNDGTHASFMQMTAAGGFNFGLAGGNLQQNGTQVALVTSTVANSTKVNGALVTVASSAPGSPTTGDIWIDTSIVL